MFNPTRIIIAVTLCVAVAGSVILLMRESVGTTEPSEHFSKNDQVFYAEVSTTSPQELPRTASSTEKFNLPILVYHIVRPAYPGDSRAVRNLAVTPEAFDSELLYLAQAGYHVVSFADLEAYSQHAEPLPSNPVILSFDDGWSDQFTYAFPILEKNHMTATFFVFTNPIGTRGFLSWHDLRAMRDAGMTIGSHSRSHPYLTKVTNTSALWDEISGSKQTLEKNLGGAINEFAYPFGQYSPVIVDIVRKAGYTSARGDYYRGEQSADRLYTLNAMNAPTTTALFGRKFPPGGYERF